MSHKRYQFLTILLAVVAFAASGNTQPPPTNFVPPVAIGPQNLSFGDDGVHEFLTQEGALKGDIGGIVAGEEYWVYIWGIDATSVSGVPGRRVRFHLQDSEDESSFKHLGISFSLQNSQAGGADLLECYQGIGSTVDGISTHALAPGLTDEPFDLRFRFTKEEAIDPWTVDPFFRLSGGEWTLFSVGQFTTSANNAFDFLGAKLVVIFDNGANSQAEVSFDNFFVVGPITDFSAIFVDDDWSEQLPGDVVQFPGQINVQVFGENAFAAIQDGIDQVPNQLGPSSIASVNQLNLVDNGPSLSTVHVAPGTYLENLQIDYPMIIEGAGSGEDEETNTIIDGDGGHVIAINASASGSTLRKLRVTNGSSGGSGIVMNFLGQNQIVSYKTSPTNSLNGMSTEGADFAYMTFENIAAVNNLNGIAFEAGAVADIKVINCDLSNNANSGLHIASNVDSLDGLTMQGCTVNDNGINGLTTGPGGSQNVTNIHISNSSFSGNGDALSESGMGSGDISLFQFNGDASLTNVSIHGDGAHVGLQIRGDDGNGLSPAGFVVLDSVIISGTYQHPQNWVGSAIYITGYSDVSAISLNDVEIDITPVSEIKPAINLNLENIFGSLNIGNTKFGGSASVDILNNSAAAVDAIDAFFVAAENNFEIEDRIVHAIDLEVIPGNVVQHQPKGSLLPQINLVMEPTFGLVTWVPDNVYMTPNSFAEPLTSAPSIQRAINAAPPDDTLNIAPGEYLEEPTIFVNKDLVIIGSGSDFTTIFADGSTQTVEEEGNPAWFEISECAQVHVHDMAFDGNGNSIYYAFLHNGSGTFTNVSFNDIQYDAYEGTAIYALGCNSTHVRNCTFTSIGRAGVYYWGSGVNSSIFSGNTYTGKGGGEGGDYIDYAVEVYNSSDILIENNTISNNNGALDGNWVEESAAIYLNSGNGGGASAIIRQNQIFNNLNGVLIDDSQSQATISENEIDENTTGVKVKSALYVLIEKNDITDNETGVDLANVFPTFDIKSNSILNNGVGVVVTNSAGEIDDNVISGQSENGVTIQDAVSVVTTINGNEFCNNNGLAVENAHGSGLVNATGNWWGSAAGPSRSGTPTEGDSVSADVNVEPFEIASLFTNSPCASGCLTDSEIQGNGDVNGDDAITVSDALCAFNIFLNGGILPDACDAANFQCETLAANVNCDGSVTVQDALDIFKRFLDQAPPSNCFAQEVSQFAKPAAGRLNNLSLIQSAGVENNQIKIGLMIDNPAHLSAFGLDITYPTDKLRYLGIERAAVTADWTQLEAAQFDDGVVRVGGFNLEASAAASAGELFRLIFEMKSDAVSFNEIAVTGLVDDLQDAVVTVPASEPITSLPTAFALHQNFPNPFNPDTRIRFDIPKVSDDGVLVTIKIYNITGQVVRTLLNEKRAAGSHSIIWDGRNDIGQPAASGTYFYSITAGDFKESKRMIMVK